MRRIIRPTLATAREGFSREAIDDLLIGLAAAWEGEDPQFPSAALLAQVRAEPAKFEPLVGAVWVLRQSTDEHQRQRAHKLLDESPDALPVVTLGLRDPGFAKVGLQLCRNRPWCPVLISLLQNPGSSGLPREEISHRLGSIYARTEYVPTEGDVQGHYVAALTEPERNQILALLDHPLADVRAATAQGLRSTAAWAAGVRDEVNTALVDRLADTAVTPAACELITQNRLDWAVPRLRGALESTAHPAEVLKALLACGDLPAVLAAFDQATLEVRTALVWPLASGGVRPKRFLLERVATEATPLKLRGEMYRALISYGEANAVLRFAFLENE